MVLAARVDINRTDARVMPQALYHIVAAWLQKE
jgi:hypothetical protein